jgi:hypothetical protein
MGVIRNTWSRTYPTFQLHDTFLLVSYILQQTSPFNLIQQPLSRT